jgi:hypothetical protein
MMGFSVYHIRAFTLYYKGKGILLINPLTACVGRVVGGYAAGI